MVMASNSRVDTTVKRENDAMDMRRTRDVPKTAPVYFGHFHRTKSCTSNFFVVVINHLLTD